MCRSEQPGPGVWISFEEHSGWIVAGIAAPGWLAELDRPARQAFASALAGLYKMASVNLVREPIAQALRTAAESVDAPEVDFDFREDGLVVTLDPADPAEILYLLRPEPGTPPLVTLGHAEITPPALDTRSLIFGDANIPWSRWVSVWEADRHGFDHPAQLLADLPMLPHLDAADEVTTAAVVGPELPPTPIGHLS